MNNHYEKFENKGMKSYRLHKPDTPYAFGMEKMSKFNTRKKYYLSNVLRIGGAHLQCVNNHYAKFEYKGIKTVGVTDYTNMTPPTHFG